MIYEQAKTKGYSLYPRHEAIIEKAMAYLRRKTPSDAVQYIIEDWAKTNLKAEPEPESPTPQKHKA